MLVKIFYRYFAIFLKINESTYSISLTYKLGFFVFKMESRILLKHLFVDAINMQKNNNSNKLAAEKGF